MQKLKTTRKNIGWYFIELNGRTFEALQTEDRKEWNIGEVLDNGYGGFTCDSYDETFWTLRDCKNYVTRVA